MNIKKKKNQTSCITISKCSKHVALFIACFGVAGALSALSIPAWTSPKADPWGASGMSENATNWADFSSATFESSTIPFQASFPETAAADKAANMEETKVENTAASGDHPHHKTAENQSCSSQLSPSM